MAEKTYLQAISDSLRLEMRRDQRVFVLGEDVGVYGGAFKVTQGFQEEFGASRVLDMPLSETAIVARRDRRGPDGHAPGRRDAVRRLRLLRLGPPRHGRGEAALPHGTPIPIVLRLPSGGGFSGGPVPLAEPRVELRAHPGAEGRLPGDARGREGAPRDGDRGSEPRPLLRAQAPVPPDPGRGAGRPLHDAVRQGAHPPRGRRRHRDHLGRDGLHGGRRGRRSSPRRACPSRSSTCAR